MFKPNAQQFATQIRVQNRITPEVSGAPEVSFQDASPALDFCNWKGKGGTKIDEFGVIDTADVTMWYRPDIAELDRVLLDDDETKAYEILNVENLEQRNMWLLLKVQRVRLQLPHIVTLQAKQITRNEALLSVETWVNVVTVSAAVETLTGREVVAGTAVAAEYTAKIRMVYLDGVTAGMRAMFRGRTFNINSVINVDEKNEELELMCTEHTVGG